MKFKSILLIFNVVLLIVLVSITFLPLLIIGKDFFSLFLQKNWIIILIFLLVIGGVDLYFFLNWRLFSLLESESWKELIAYLEDQIYNKNRIRKMYVKILLNAYLLTSNLDSMVKLEKFLTDRKKHFINKFSVAFSVPYLLKSDPVASEAFFAKLLSDGATSDIDWIRWNYAFTLMQQKQFEAAKEELVKICRDGKERIPLLLSLYFLSSYARYDSDVRDMVDAGKTRLSSPSGKKKLLREIEKSNDNMEALILSQIIREANDWLDAKRDDLSSAEYHDVKEEVKGNNIN